MKASTPCSTLMEPVLESSAATKVRSPAEPTLLTSEPWLTKLPPLKSASVWMSKLPLAPLVKRPLLQLLKLPLPLQVPAPLLTSPLLTVPLRAPSVLEALPSMLSPPLATIWPPKPPIWPLLKIDTPVAVRSAMPAKLPPFQCQPITVRLLNSSTRPALTMALSPAPGTRAGTQLPANAKSPLPPNQTRSLAPAGVTHPSAASTAAADTARRRGALPCLFSER